MQKSAFMTFFEQPRPSQQIEIPGLCSNNETLLLQAGHLYGSATSVENIKFNYIKATHNGPLGREHLED